MLYVERCTYPTRKQELYTFNPFVHQEDVWQRVGKVPVPRQSDIASWTIICCT